MAAMGHFLRTSELPAAAGLRAEEAAGPSPVDIFFEQHAASRALA